MKLVPAWRVFVELMVANECIIHLCTLTACMEDLHLSHSTFIDIDAVALRYCCWEYQYYELIVLMRVVVYLSLCHVVP